MRKLLFASLALVLLAGCSSTPYVDAEFGRASRMAFDRQIADKTYQHANQTPEGIAGLTGEQVMKVYTDGFGEKPRTIYINTLNPGSASSGR